MEYDSIDLLEEVRSDGSTDKLRKDPYIKVWLLNLVIPGRYGRWLTSATIFGFLYGCFSLLGVFDTAHPELFSSGAAFFFCVILAYIIPIYHYITERTEVELHNLDPVLALDDVEREHLEHVISHKHRVWYAWVLCIGLLMGLGHNLLLSGSLAVLLTMFNASSAAGSMLLATIMVWVVMTFALAGLIDNALIFARLAGKSVVDLLNTAALTPFARVAVFSTLAVIGAQASLPFMLIDGYVSPLAYVPGIIATCGPMFLLFALPVWPIHRAIARAKNSRIAELNAAIGQEPDPDLTQPETLAGLNSLLSFRREIQLVSEWPFDVSVVTRLGLYLIIPPLTWVGAALGENLVEALIR